MYWSVLIANGYLEALVWKVVNFTFYRSSKTGFFLPVLFGSAGQTSASRPEACYIWAHKRALTRDNLLSDNTTPRGRSTSESYHFSIGEDVLKFQKHALIYVSSQYVPAGRKT